MSDNRSRQKRTLIVLVVFFLLIGGGIFTFFIFQGLGDLRGDNKGGFSYGFAERVAVLPLFQYFGLSDNEKPAPIRDRGLDPALFKPRADISDWMAKPDASGGANGAKGGASSPAKATVIPRMGGSSSGSMAGGSGGSQTSGSASQFSAGSGSGNAKISAGQAGKGGAQGRGAALNALASAKASLGEGLRSGSAMAGRSKWGTAFGSGSGGKSDNFAYAKSGLVKLDTIKSGEIESLKSSDISTLMPTPVKDLASEAKDPNLAKMKGKEGADAAKDALKSAVGQVGGQQSEAKDEKTGKPVEMPPQKVIDAATTPPPKGTFCPDGCGKGSEYYRDSNVRYAKGTDGQWKATYEGTDAKGQQYNDTVGIDISKDPPVVTPEGSSAQINGVWQQTNPGTSDPINPSASTTGAVGS